MRILIVGLHIQDGIGGAEIQADLIARHMNDRGHNVMYAVANPDSSCSSLPYAFRKITPPHFYSFIKILRNFKPDIIYWRKGRNKLLISAISARILRIKFSFAIAHVKDTTVWNTGMLRSQLQDFHKSGLNLKSLITLLVSLKRQLGYAVNYFGAYFIHTVFYMNDELKNTLPGKNYIKQHNSFEIKTREFKRERPYIIWVSNLSPRKNPETCIDLAKQLSNENIDILMAGKIADPRYSWFNNPERLPDNLFYLGEKSIDEINGIVKSSELLFHTCSPEGFPNIFIQAWLLSKPTVTLHYDPDSIIKKNRLGYHSGNLRQMTADIKSLLSNPAINNEIGSRASEFSSKLFDPRRNMDKLEEHFKNITGK